MGKRICPVDGCEREQRSRGFCGMHYARWHRHGDTTALVVHHEGDPEKRFWAKVEKTDGCWNWTAGTVTGYGNHSANGKHVLAHRFAYELLVGPIPDAMQIDHRCHNRRCVNPDHLRPASNKQNVENHQGGPRSDSKSGIRGVSWHSHSQLWRATVRHDGVVVTRYFHSREDASSAVIAMRNELHSFNDKDRVSA